MPSESTPWPVLAADRELRVVKWSPAGEPVTSYQGWVIDAGSPNDWIAVRADWTTRLVEMNGLRFVPGDRLHEFFSPAHPFNVLSVWSPEGALRGWYANVTHPAMLDATTEPPTLIWHDLFIDLIGLPDGAMAIRDEDELAASGLADSDPALYRAVLESRDRLVALFAQRAFPFHER